METTFNLSPILFLDIETIPQYPSFDSCPDSVQQLWARKAANLKKEEHETHSDIYNRAGIYAEFGQIICISTGFLYKTGNEMHLKIKSFYGKNERNLLDSFATLLNDSFSSQQNKLCAHNGKEFDFPYIARRMIINNIKLPLLLDISGKKPWEIAHLDTMELWKFGDFKSYTPLNLLAHALGVPSPKDDIDGSQVWTIYWNNDDLDRIVSYCQKDVEALVNVFLRMKGLSIIDKHNIHYVE